MSLTLMSTRCRHAYSRATSALQYEHEGAWHDEIGAGALGRVVRRLRFEVACLRFPFDRKRRQPVNSTAHGERMRGGTRIRGPAVYGPAL